jgi:nitrate reductase gamma subunit
VFVVVNLTLIALWSSVASTLPDLRGLVVASIAVLAVGIVCLVGVIVLGTRWRGTHPPEGATGSSAATVLAAVAVAQLVVGLAMTLLGAFNDLFALQIFLATMVSSVTVLVLGVGLSRRISKAGAAG